jgi:hypothetical protein
MSQHTPLPWATDGGKYSDVIEIWGTKDGTLHEHVADIEIPQLEQGEAGEAPGTQTAHDNAALIVRAVNAFAPLRAALEAVLGEADMESADGNDDVQRCVVCRKDYDIDTLPEDETQFLCSNPDCAAGKARLLLKEIAR